MFYSQIRLVMDGEYNVFLKIKAHFKIESPLKRSGEGLGMKSWLKLVE